MVDPISAEELDIDGNIHRYNFGWMVTRTIVSIGGMADIPGVITETTETGISGNDKVFYEKVTQEILPPALDAPTDIGMTTVMQQSGSIGTYYRTGRKKRQYTKAKVFGTSEIISMGETPFAVLEQKEYADVSAGTLSVYLPDIGESNHADGGAQYTIANGVKTTTEIKG